MSYGRKPSEGLGPQGGSHIVLGPMRVALAPFNGYFETFNQNKQQEKPSGARDSWIRQAFQSARLLDKASPPELENSRIGLSEQLPSGARDSWIRQKRNVRGFSLVSNKKPYLW